MDRQAKNFLGWVCGVVVVLVLVVLGHSQIQTDGQLAVTIMGMMALILLMGIVMVYKRSQRFTYTAVKMGKDHGPFDPIEKMEQRCLQLSAVLATSTIILCLWQKGPKLWKIAIELLNR